jgi:hypothetical protein
MGDLFALQNEVTSRIAVALDLELIGAEVARPTEHPDALDYILRGRATRPERRRFREANPHGKCIYLLDLHILIAADRRGSGCRVGGVFPIEYDIVGGKGPTVMPLDACFKLPGYGHAVGSHPTVLDVRDLGGEHRDEVPVRMCVQQKLACSAGDKPAGVEVRAP